MLSGSVGVVILIQTELLIAKSAGDLKMPLYDQWENRPLHLFPPFVILVVTAVRVGASVYA